MLLTSIYKHILERTEIYNSIIVNYNKEYPIIGGTAYGKTKTKNNEILY